MSQINKKYDSIQQRIYNIDEILLKSNLKNTSPLYEINNATHTEKFEGNQKRTDDAHSLDTRYALNKQTLKFENVIEQLNSEILYIKSGSFGSIFCAKIHSKTDQTIIENTVAIKITAFSKREGYGSINNIMRPENTEICMLKLLSYFVIKKYTPHLILPISTFNTNIKTFIDIWDDGTIDKIRQDSGGQYIKNNKGEYVEFALKYIKDKDAEGKFIEKKKMFFVNEIGDYVLKNKVDISKVKVKRSDFIAITNNSEYYIRNYDEELLIITKDEYDTLKRKFQNPSERYRKVNNKYDEFVKNYKKGYFNDTVSVLITEWADRGDLSTFLKKINRPNDLPNYEKLTLIQWQCLFFQFISTIAIIQHKYESFRHNDCKLNNILISKIQNPNYQTLYPVGNDQYIVPNIGYCIYLWDFDFACIPGVINNKKLHKKWTFNANIKPVKNRYYDIHYFFCTLVYKGFIPEIMSSINVPQEVKNFINWVIPYEYRPLPINKHKVDTDKCRLLVDDEVHLPINILKHEFFSSFRKK